MKTFLKLIAFSTVLISAAANATVAYQQGNINTADRGAYQYFGQALADDFVSMATGSITNATWTGSYYGPANTSGSESFTFQVYDAGALPGALLYSSVGVASFVTSSTASYYDYNLNLAGPTLTAGNQYWLSIYSNASPENYAWANSSDGSPSAALNNFGGPWRSIDGDIRSNHVFALNVSAVPEPETYGMLFAGLMVLGAFARRRVNQSK